MPVVHRTGGCLERNFPLTPLMFHTAPNPNLSSLSLLEETGWLRRREPNLRRVVEEVGKAEEGRTGRGGR